MKIKAFHGSTFDFDKIELYKSYDIGFHCGTLNQAINRIYDDSKNKKSIFDCFIYEVNLDVNSSNMITTDDCITWGDYNRVYNEISKTGFVLKDCHTLEDIRNLLVNSGIQYIRYKNEVEGVGRSYVILTENHNIKKHKLDKFLYQIDLILQPFNQSNYGTIRNI